MGKSHITQLENKWKNLCILLTVCHIYGTLYIGGENKSKQKNKGVMYMLLLLIIILLIGIYLMLN